MYSLEFHEEAEREYRQAYTWYGSQQQGLEERFNLAVNEALHKLQERPQYFGYTRKPYREISVKDFPYTIVFKINTRNKLVYISAIYHTSRNPTNKFRKKRAN